MPVTDAILEKVNAFSNLFNFVTLGTSFVLSIMVINNYNQCEKGKGYPASTPMVSFSYGISIFLLIIIILIFVLQMFNFYKSRKGD